MIEPTHFIDYQDINHLAQIGTKELPAKRSPGPINLLSSRHRSWDFEKTPPLISSLHVLPGKRIP